MESNERYYARRAVEELRAFERAVTPEARARRLELAQSFQLKALECTREYRAEQKLASRALEIDSLAPEPSKALSYSRA